MDNTGGHLKVYASGDYVQMALYTLMNSVCNYLECKVSEEVPSVDQVKIDQVLQCKLEQAADLIKKYLLHSVREEMDAMKGKLCDLETKIYRLEMENTLLLREYVPAEILEQRRIEESADQIPMIASNRVDQQVITNRSSPILAIASSKLDSCASTQAG